MDKRDILELKKRLTKTECTITRMCGCYVDANREKLVHIGETFLNLEDEEFYKYLDIARKCLSGNVGNNLLMLEYPTEEEAPGGHQQFLMGLRASALKNPELLENFYDQIISHYEYAGNYLILIFHDAYDIITRTSDKLKLDESEEVYEYLLCAICPVELSKPGLGYRQDENRIGPRIRDWVVGMPDAGFIFPAFSDHSADIHSLIYYLKDPKDSHPDFVEDALGCGSRRTATEQQKTFQSIIKRALGPGEDENEEALFHIQESLQNRMPIEDDELPFDEEEPVMLTSEVVDEILEENDIHGDAAQHIREEVEKEFADERVEVRNLIDEKAMAKKAKEREEAALRLKVQELQKEIIEKEQQLNDNDIIAQQKIFDVIVRVKPEKANQIKSQVIGGQKCLIIPMDENEHINLNGVNTQV